jgi:hypothetical protein
LDFLQVQRATVFRDSLDEVPAVITDLLNFSNKDKANVVITERTRVMNEEGQLLEVIFDPVLKCYYEPTKH